MTTLVIPWRGDHAKLLEASLATALQSFRPSSVLIIGGYEDKAWDAFAAACERGGMGDRLISWQWAGNPIYPKADPLGQTNAAMKLACSMATVTDLFVWSADDVFWPKRLLDTRVLTHTKNWVLTHAMDSPRLGNGIHGRALQNTITDLMKAGWHPDDIFDFEGHWPLVVEKKRMLKALALSPKGQKRSVYGNLLLKEKDLLPSVHQDIKVFKGADLPDRSDRFVSTGTGVTEKEVERWLMS